MKLFIPFLRNLIRFGRLTVIDANGQRHTFGAGAAPDLPPVTIRLKNKNLHWKLVTQPSLAVGEAFTKGDLVVEEGTIYDFLVLVMKNLDRASYLLKIGDRWSAALKFFQQFNSASRSKRNVAHHYDLSNDFYQLFLDSDMQYSCAYFPKSDASLEEAQLLKKHHIAAKLMLKPGQKVLDIGCGWGGMALYLAKYHDVHVTGVTLSEEQLKLAQQRAVEQGLTDRVEFLLRDYRSLVRKYDRIVSVGMFEHVGVPSYRKFFADIARLLKEDGVALIHSIGRAEGPGITNGWIRKYIFPGGYFPALSEVLPAVEKSGVFTTDIEILRRQYGPTLRLWRERFMAQREETALMFDEPFCRMWEFYLAGAEAGFLRDELMVFQIQLGHPDAPIPLTRDYMVDAERDYQKIVIKTE